MGLIFALWKIDVLKTSIIELGTSKKLGSLGWSTRQDQTRWWQHALSLLSSLHHYGFFLSSFWVPF